ncbi:MAG: hypothetical protein FJ011_18445 [Chloroflexi bacterium]|nr:hypothetical protein [Chloroflexota bacterium]
MKHLSLFVCLVVVASMFAGCAAPTPQVVEKEVTKVVEKVVEQKVVQTVVVAGTPQVVEKVITATPAPKTGPVAGGKLVYALTQEPDTLDVHKSGILFIPCQLFGASLLARNPETGEIVPYLAESWTKAENGMSYEFKLRKDVKFHDGTPLTAQDYAYTFMRAIDPATKSPTAGQTLVGLKSAEAVDNYTLRLNMSMPNSVLANSMTNNCYLQPIPKAAVEKMGDQFGRKPIGTGPFKVKEWVTGQRIVLERNPDFTWGPSFTHGGAPYIETIEFRIIPEYATQLAGFESGEIDFIVPDLKDLKRLEDAGKYRLVKTGIAGSGVHLEMNATRAPFDDVRLRKAVNYALDRKGIVQAVAAGRAAPLYGPLTPATVGYWPGAEYIGYQYDVAKAKAQLTEAGYAPNASGIMEKGGKPLALTLLFSVQHAKVAEIVQQQLKAVGIDAKLEQREYGVLYQTLSGGDFDLGIDQLGWPDAGVLFVMFHSSTIGGWNRARVKNLDGMVGAFVVSTTQEGFEKTTADLQRKIIEDALTAPIYAPVEYSALNKRIQGPFYAPVNRWLYLWDAYIQTGPVK